MTVPQNWQTVVSYLEGHGYTPIAAAGIAGNIEQESGGDPEAQGDGGGGLIGFTPLPDGYVTGNTQKDLELQLGKILAYNNEQGNSAIQQLNAAKTPQQAAQIYDQVFERPAKATANLAGREASAAQTFAAMQKGGLSSGNAAAGQGTGIETTGLGLSLNPFSWLLSGLGIDNLSDLLERAGLILLGALLVIVGILRFTSAGDVLPVPGLKHPDNATKEPKDSMSADEEKNARKNAGSLDFSSDGETKGFQRARNKDKSGKEDSSLRARRYAQANDSSASSEVPF